MLTHLRRHLPPQVCYNQHLVVTAYEDNAQELDDAALLARATEFNRVLFTPDDDLLVLARQWQQQGLFFAAIIYAHQLRTSIGACITDLELIARAGEADDIASRVQFLPL